MRVGQRLFYGRKTEEVGEEENRSRTGGMRKSDDERRTEALTGNEGRRRGEEENRSRTGGMRKSVGDRGQRLLKGRRTEEVGRKRIGVGQEE
jgi:hypothetical protein